MMGSEFLIEMLGQGSAWNEAWHYSWTPTWNGPFWLVAVIGAVCIAIVVMCYLVELRGAAFSKRALLTLLRSVSIGLLAWMLLGWSFTPYTEEPSDLVVLVDSSQSMLTEDVANGTKRNTEKSIARIDRAKSLLLQDSGMLAEASRRFRPRVAHFGEQTSWLSFDPIKIKEDLQNLEASGGSTRLGDAIHDALRLQRGREATAMVILSDGVRTAGLTLENAAKEAKAAGIPLYVVGLGQDTRPRDVRLANLIYSTSVFLGDVVYVEADLEMEGFGEKSLRVQLRDRKSGEVFATETVNVREGQPSRVRIPIRLTKLGKWEFSLEVERPEGDSNPDNNTLHGVIDVQEETVRVLVIDRQPRYDYRYLTDLLIRARKRGAPTEPAFEVKTFLQEGDLGLASQDAAALSAIPTREELAQFDVIVLGDIDPEQLGLTANHNLLEAITRGGAGLVLLPAAGESFRRWEDSPLELLLPARAEEIMPLGDSESTHRGALTSIGKQTAFCSLGERTSQSDSAWKTLPPFLGLLKISQLRPEVRVLVEDSEMRMENGRPSPIVTMHYVGAAKVTCHLTDEWWRWAAPNSRGYYDQYWLQAMRFVCSQKTPPSDDQFELTSDADRYQEGDPVRLSLQFRDERVSPSDDHGAVVALSSGETKREVVLRREEGSRNVFRTAVSDLPPGNYQATVVRPAVMAPLEKECRFEIATLASESARLRPDFDALRNLAKLSGGKFYTDVTAADLVGDLPRTAAVRTMPLPPQSAWNLPVWAALLVGLLSLEWFLRRAAGLL